jgi:hypothetical protein
MVEWRRRRRKRSSTSGAELRQGGGLGGERTKRRAKAIIITTIHLQEERGTLRNARSEVVGIEESQECAGGSGGLFAEGRDLLIAWLGTFVDIRDVRAAECAECTITTRSAVGLLNASGGRVGGWHKPAVNNLTVKNM